MSNNENKAKGTDNTKSPAKKAPTKAEKTLADAQVKAEEIKATAIAEAEKIVADAQAEALEIENDAKGEAGDIVADANKEALVITEQMQVQRDKDDLSRGEPDLDSDTQPYRNEGKVNLFTEGGRCNPNQTVNLTLDQAGKYKGLVPCTTANE
jgi:hypothetical protein